MRKIMFMCMAMLMMAGCAKDVAPLVQNDIDSAQTKASEHTAGETIQISVTLPQVDVLVTKVSLAANPSGGFDPLWQEGDRILVSGEGSVEEFTLVSSEGKKGIFTGKMPKGMTYNISYPAFISGPPSPDSIPTQNGDNDYSHLSYVVSVTGVDTIEDVHFSHGWAAEHGGTFMQSGYLKLILNLPAGTSAVKYVEFAVDGQKKSAINVENGTVSGNSFTAYLPCSEINLEKDKKVTLFVTADNAELTNTFFPGPQTLHRGHLISLTTSSMRWIKKLSGKGSENDPYLIKNLEELDNVRNLISLNTHTHFKLAADIDMSGVKEWIPYVTVNEPYGIVFDGDGHKITNFTCTHNKWASFIGVLHGTVRNLTFEDATVTTTATYPCGVVSAWVGNNDGTLQGSLENVKVVRGKMSCSALTQIGGLAGRSCEGTFINCSFDGVVERTGAAAYSSTYYATGGILGEAISGVVIKGCSTSGTLTTAAGRACGGILGLCSNALDITDCSSSMNISARDDVAGGIVGYYGNGTISGCHVKSDITVAEKGSGSSYVGGIAAHTAGSVTITDCTYEGHLKAYAHIVGGILGQCNASSGDGAVITKCFASGTIQGGNTIGGIIGRATNNGLSISDCGAAMDITATASYVGGVAGDLPKNTTLRNCFATGSVTGSFSLGGIAGRAFGRQSSSASLDAGVETTIEGCIAFNSSIKTNVEGGEDPSGHYSGGAVIGCSSRPNTLKNCWRKNGLPFYYYKNEALNVLFDHADSSPSTPLVQPAGSERWFSPYHGKEAAEGATLSSIAQSAGWSSDIWDFSTDVPKLK